MTTCNTIVKTLVSGLQGVQGFLSACDAQQIPPSHAFGAFLKQQREAQELSVTALADKMSITRSYLNSIESGKRSPSSHMVEAVILEGIMTTEAATALRAVVLAA